MRKIGSVDNCQKCGAEYVVKTGSQKFCPECSLSDTARRASKKYYDSTHPLPSQRECAFCGTIFTPKDHRNTLCSDGCRSARKALQQRQHVAANADAIRERKRRWRLDRISEKDDPP
ncbi:MAG: hypothetical protein FWG40_00515 [Peptococcaceae bacterium]|nr:hypothetical protein [Peptococcaceae bacterium]